MAPVVKLDVASVPAGVKLRQVPRVKEDGTVDGYDTPIAASCYVFETLDGKRQYLNADESMATWAALAPAEEGEDLGSEVGELFKLDPRDGSLKWAGEDGSRFPIRQKQLDRLTSACSLMAEKV